MNNITYQQKIFCDSYLISLNATDAALKAGYSENSARSKASQLMKIPKIRDYIDKRMKKKESKLIASQNEVLELLTQIAREEIEVDRSSDRIKAIELLGKRYALFSDKIIDERAEKVDDKLGDILEQLKKGD